jgi:hypothetical protein
MSLLLFLDPGSRYYRSVLLQRADDADLYFVWLCRYRREADHLRLVVHLPHHVRQLQTALSIAKHLARANNWRLLWDAEVQDAETHVQRRIPLCDSMPRRLLTTPAVPNPREHDSAPLALRLTLL